MSFSSEVKCELLSITNQPCCMHAQCYGLLLFGRAFSDSEISILTENSDVADIYSAAVSYLSGFVPETQETAGGKFKVTVESKEAINAVFEKLGINDQGSKKRINFANFQNPCCFASFVRGAFLASGTVTDPEKEYHLEFSVSSKRLAEDLIKLFDEYEPTPKIAQRSGAYTVYFKSSADIEDILAIIGATEKSLQYMGTKMYKDIRNTVNRKVNFEKANLTRTVIAATKQYEAIAFIKEKIGFDALPEELQEIARLRYEDRELSNAEIARLLPESITVSGVNHRFKRLIKIAEDLKK